MIQVKIIADSISEAGKRITTFQLSYPRFIHAELMTHRVFSRNASSSRAIPVMKMLAQVWNDPAIPVHWGQNQSGMQAKQELEGLRLKLAKKLWTGAGKVACVFAWGMNKIGLHKQIANRILEPWQNIHVVLTATEFDNWFELRAHPDAQPEIQALAKLMLEAMTGSKPKLLNFGEWHLPYITDADWATLRSETDNDGVIIDRLRKISAARCCRVSYLKHDGTSANIKEDLALCERLAGSRPIHASPFEHQATPDHHVSQNGEKRWSSPNLHGNFDGWIQYRKFIEVSFA